MTVIAEETAFAVWLLFCRAGGCMLLAPGLSSARIPMRIRLLVSFALVLGLAPLLSAQISRDVAGLAPEDRLLLILGESVTGLVIGFMARSFIIGLQFAANTISAAIGLAGIPGAALEESEQGSPLAALVSSSAVMILLALGLHIELLRAVIDSYSVISLSAHLTPAVLLDNVTQVLAETSVLAVRLAGPFIVYGITMNVALGLANRFVPQISFYHVTTGVVMLLGLLLFRLIWPDWMMIFLDSYGFWLRRGGF